MPTILTTNLIFQEEKKHSIRYVTELTKDAVSSVYVMKTVLGKKPWPQAIKLTLEWE